MIVCSVVPYSQAARPPCCSPPVREYVSPSEASRQRDTDRWRRQVTRLPRPFPQYPPLTLRYGTMRLLCCASGVANTGQRPWGSARTFDIIVLTGRGWGPHLLPSTPNSQAVFASKSIPQQRLTYILNVSRSLSCCFSRCRRRAKIREQTGEGYCQAFRGRHPRVGPVAF